MESVNLLLRRARLGTCLGLCGAGVLFAHGSSNSEADLLKPYVIGGTDAPLDKYPWAVALVGRSASDGEMHEKQFCTGVLVHPYWVLTAAHCVSDLESYDYLAVAVGNGNLQEGSMSERVVDLVIRHHYYVPAIDREADVALLRLREPVLDRAPIAINLDDQLDRIRGEGRILGWGKTNQNFNEPDQVKRLQEAILPIADRALVNSAAHFDGRLTETMFAAGKASPLTSGYPGDSGGPFVIENVGSEDFVLLGITSWGYTCDLDTTPYGVFGSVSKHSDWIASVISPDNLEFDEALRFAKYKEVETLENRVELRPQVGNGKLGFSLEQSMNGRSNLRLTEGTIDYWIFDPELRFHRLRGFSPLDQNWYFDYEREVLQRKIEPTSIAEDRFLLKVEHAAGISPRPGPYPLSPGMLASGNQLSDMSFWGKRTIWFELLGHQVGDLLTFSGWSPGDIGLAIVECGGEQTNLVAKNFTRNRSSPHGSQSLEVAVKHGMRYYGIVHESHSFEVTSWVNLDRKEIKLNKPVSGTLDASDTRTPREGHFSEFFEMHDKSRQALQVDLYSDFDGTLQLIELESGKILLKANNVDRNKTESLIFYHKHADKSIGVRILNTNYKEMGNYRIEFKAFSKPRELRVGATSRSALMESSESQYLNGRTVYFDYWDLEGLTPNRRTYVSVEGIGSYAPSFAILDMTGRNTVFEGFSVCPDDSVASFVPVAGKRYVLGIAGMEESLNENYKVSCSTTPIVLSTTIEGNPVKKPKFPMDMRAVIWSPEFTESH